MDDRSLAQTDCSAAGAVALLLGFHVYFFSTFGVALFSEAYHKVTFGLIHRRVVPTTRSMHEGISRQANLLSDQIRKTEQGKTF